MYSGRLEFSQLMDFLLMPQFQRCVERYNGNYHIKTFSCFDQFLWMAFAQLSYRESLRDIESCLRAMQNKLYHTGIRGNISKSTLADANESRDWRFYADFAQVLINIARDLYVDDDFGVELDETVYALDASTIDLCLCLSLFPWAQFRKTKGAIKLHTLLDLRGSIPTFISITDGKVHDVNVLDELIPEPGAFYIMDRGYLDFKRLRKWGHPFPHSGLGSPWSRSRLGFILDLLLQLAHFIVSAAEYGVADIHQRFSFNIRFSLFQVLLGFVKPAQLDEFPGTLDHGHGLLDSLFLD